jgi:2'-hydroxyisoflavone reductase
MKLLILGGTRFLGRHLAEQALARGHALTLVHRGQSGPELFAQATHVHADRNTPALAAALQDRGPWDACIDTCAYFPRQVRLAAGALAGRVRHYQLVSSISVYAAFDADGAHEDSALAALADNTT